MNNFIFEDPNGSKVGNSFFKQNNHVFIVGRGKDSKTGCDVWQEALNEKLLSKINIVRIYSIDTSKLPPFIKKDLIKASIKAFNGKNSEYYFDWNNKVPEVFEIEPDISKPQIFVTDSSLNLLLHISGEFSDSKLESINKVVSDIAEKYVMISDIKMAYYEHGHGDNIWLVIHGNRDKKEYLEPIAKKLAEKEGNHVYNIDLRGHGSSDKPSYSYSTEMFVDDVLQFIKKMNIKELNILGHSLGAMLAILINCREPEMIKKLVLIAASPHFKPKFRPEGLKDYNKISIEQINKNARKFLFSEKYPAVADLVISNWQATQESVHKSLLGLTHPYLDDDLKLIKRPTLLIYGKNDNSTPKIDRELVKNNIPNSKLEVIESCSHYVYLEEPQKVDELISSFIKDEAYSLI